MDGLWLWICVLQILLTSDVRPPQRSAKYIVSWMVFGWQLELIDQQMNARLNLALICHVCVKLLSCFRHVVDICLSSNVVIFLLFRVSAQSEDDFWKSVSSGNAIMSSGNGTR